jgi:hypothetical protein
MPLNKLFYPIPNSMKGFRIVIAVLVFPMLGCPMEEELSNCSLSLVENGTITVTANVSGEKGTQITPDEIIESSITPNSAEVRFTVLRIGSCHRILGYGHVWSPTKSTPSLGENNVRSSDFGANVNFNDEVITKWISLYQIENIG